MIYIETQSSGGILSPVNGIPSVLGKIPFVFSSFPSDGNTCFPSFFASLELLDISGYFNNIQLILESPPDINGHVTKTMIYVDTPTQVNNYGYRSYVKFIPDVYIPYDGIPIKFNSEIDPEGTYRCTILRPDLIGAVPLSPNYPIDQNFEALERAQCIGNGTWNLYVIDSTGLSNFSCSQINLTLQADNRYRYILSPHPKKIGLDLQLNQQSVIEYPVSGINNYVLEMILLINFYSSSSAPITYDINFPNQGYIFIKAPSGELCSLAWRQPLNCTDTFVYHSTNIANKPAGFDPNSVIGNDPLTPWRWSYGLEDERELTPRYSTIFSPNMETFPVGLDNLINANPNGTWKIGFVSASNQTKINDLSIYINASSSSNTTSPYP